MEKINFENGVTKGNATTFNQMQDNIEKAIGKIVESGSNDNGNYVKFSDGTMICHKRSAIKSTINNAWGSLYTSKLLQGFTYPVPFVERPKISLEVEAPLSVWSMFSGVGSTTTTPNYYILSGVTNNEDLFDISYIAIGKWK